MIRSALLGAMATRIPMLIPADARFPKPQTALKGQGKVRKRNTGMQAEGRTIDR
jgi:hypothetical protein